MRSFYQGSIFAILFARVLLCFLGIRFFNDFTPVYVILQAGIVECTVRKWIIYMVQEQLWTKFAEKHVLNQHQLEQFKAYYAGIIRANELFNLTAITELSSALAYHFEDSLALENFVSLPTMGTLSDIGSGAGFPCLPLKIKYPHLKLILIEVTNKKIDFLRAIARELYLEDVEVYPLDWRTFLRTTHYDIDLFCSRASLAPEELLRIFRHNCPYRGKTLVYWASEQWQSTATQASYVSRVEEYKIKRVQRKLVFFASPV
jgi:16S rRNA (guanine(527)-N(7))-methyltransferase RsmG